jgi:CHRD domain-containing protein
MTRIRVIRLFAVVAALGLTMTVASADEQVDQFATRMTGFNETPPILTNGHGSFHATLQGTSLTYTETFSDLTTTVTQSHIHFAERGVPGNVFVFLCTSLGNGPAGTPACPGGGGTVTGTITAAQVLGVPSQNISAGDFAGLVRILLSGDAYVNVHTTKFPAGEIRGQLQFGGD